MENGKMKRKLRKDFFSFFCLIRETKLLVILKRTQIKISVKLSKKQMQNEKYSHKSTTVKMG